jgi:hypothetical protein
MAKIEAIQLAHVFKPRRTCLWHVGSPLATAMTSSDVFGKKHTNDVSHNALELPIIFLFNKSSNDAIHNALGVLIVFCLRKARIMPFTTRLVWPASNGYNAKSTELNIAKSRFLRGSFICFDKSGSFCQLGFSNHSGRWKNFQSKIRLAVKTGRTQHCMMWDA